MTEAVAESGHVTWSDKWALFRGSNVVVGALTVPVGALMVASSFTNAEWLVIGLHSLCVAFFMGAWNTFNDVMDIEADTINHPNRPLPSGRVTETEAKAMGRALFLLSIICLLVAMFVSARSTDYLGDWIVSIVIWFVAFLLMFHYEMVVPASFMLKHKGIWGNLAVSVLVGVVIVFGAAAVGKWDTPLVWVVGASAALANAAREIVKDVEDVEGDSERETLTMKVGANKARAYAQGFVILSLIPLMLPYGLEWLPMGFLVLQVPAMMVLLTVKPRLFRGEDHAAQRSLRLGMVLGLLGFLASVLLQPWNPFQ
jgi:geranylgeranylglycerol-phosphate geranylgeranyltransferase